MLILKNSLSHGRDDAIVSSFDVVKGRCKSIIEGRQFRGPVAVVIGGYKIPSAIRRFQERFAMLMLVRNTAILTVWDTRVWRDLIYSS